MMNTLILAASLSISFAEGQWNKDDFALWKAPRHDYVNDFVQKKDHIENRCPEGATAEDVYRKFCGKVYSVMLYKEKFRIGATISSTMGWDYLMAPIITLAGEPEKNAGGETELRDHWEVCLYNGGINLWHHFYKDGKQQWYKAAATTVRKGTSISANEKHELKVTIDRDKKGHKYLLAECEGYSIYHQDDALPEEFYAGLNGCEGRNFFWDFKVETK